MSPRPCMHLPFAQWAGEPPSPNARPLMALYSHSPSEFRQRPLPKVSGHGNPGTPGDAHGLTGLGVQTDAAKEVACQMAASTEKLASEMAIPT